MEWRNHPTTRAFFKDLFREFNLDWPSATTFEQVMRLKGQRDVLEAIKNLLGPEDEE